MFGKTGKLIIKPFCIPEEEHAKWLAALISNVRITICGCWEWEGRIHKHRTHLGRPGYKGYPCISARGCRSTKWAHRVSYALYHGPIPEGHHIDHKCRNTICVRPDHLQAVLPIENYMLVHIRKRLDDLKKLRARHYQLPW